MMKTIRRSTFETNSSSCHSVTLFKNRKDWDDFVSHKVYINRGMYDIDEHTERFNIIDSENRDEYIKDLDEIYQYVKKALDSHIKGHFSSLPYEYTDIEIYELNYLKNNWSKDLMMKILLEPRDTQVCELEKPITVKYNWDSTGYTYNRLSVGDLYDFLFGYGKISEDIPDFYIYGDGYDGWKDAEVKEYIDKATGEELVLVTRDEEC